MGRIRCCSVLIRVLWEERASTAKRLGLSLTLIIGRRVSVLRLRWSAWLLKALSKVWKTILIWIKTFVCLIRLSISRSTRSFYWCRQPTDLARRTFWAWSKLWLLIKVVWVQRNRIRVWVWAARHLLVQSSQISLPFFLTLFELLQLLCCRVDCPTQLSTLNSGFELWDKCFGHHDFLIQLVSKPHVLFLVWGSWIGAASIRRFALGLHLN